MTMAKARPSHSLAREITRNHPLTPNEQGPEKVKMNPAEYRSVNAKSVMQARKANSNRPLTPNETTCRPVCNLKPRPQIPYQRDYQASRPRPHPRNDHLPGINTYKKKTFKEVLRTKSPPASQATGKSEAASPFPLLETQHNRSNPTAGE